MQAYAITSCRMTILTKTRSASFVRVCYSQKVVIVAFANLNMSSEDKDGKLLFLALVQS